MIIIPRHPVHSATALPHFRHPQQHVHAMRQVLPPRRPVPVFVPGANVSRQVRDFVFAGLVRPVAPVFLLGEFVGAGAKARLGQPLHS